MSEKNSESNAGERLKESVSAALDGQASELEFHRVLDSIGYNDDLRATASRYQLIGDGIRAETNAFVGVDISADVMGAIEQEESDQSTTASVPKNRKGVALLDDWWLSLGRVAMAASVACAVVFGVRSLNVINEVPLVAINGPTTLSQPVALVPGGSSYGANSIRAGYNSKQHDSITPEQLAHAQNVADHATRERFRHYALQHAELSAMNNGQGILPFARLTSFDTH